MEKRFVTLYLGCGDERNTVDIEMKKDRIDYWDENRLHKHTINTDMVTGFRVGPKLVMEIYSDPFFYRLRKVLKNPRNDKDVKWDVGCPIDHGVWNGIIRSFKIWDYDYYQSIHGLRYCNRDQQCRDNEYCLCKGGEKKAEWCPVSKQRCLPKAEFLHDAERQVSIDDLVNMDCLKKELNTNKKKWGNQYETFRNIKHMIERCSGPDMIEPEDRQDLSLHYYYKADTTPSLKARHNLISKDLVKATERFDGDDGVKQLGSTQNSILCIILIAVAIFVVYQLK